MKVRSLTSVAEAVYESTKGKSGAELSHALANVVEFLDKNQLLGKSKEILRELEKSIDRDEQIVRAKVTSATPLSKSAIDELEDNLKKRYKAQHVEIDQSEDSSLISGIKVEVGDEILDLSLSHRVHQLQAFLIKN